MEFETLRQRSNAIVLSLSEDNNIDQADNLNEIEAQLQLLQTALTDANSRFDGVDLDALLAKFRFIDQNSHLLPPPPEEESNTSRSSLPIMPTPQKVIKTTPIQLQKKEKKKPAKPTAKKNTVYIYPISEDEYTRLPHYLVGRTPIDKLNVYLEKLNDLFTIVYKWKATPAHKQSPDMRIDILKYTFDLSRLYPRKMQGSSEYAKIDEEGIGMFVRMIDITGKGSSVPGPSPFKMDSVGRVALGVAKHLGRIREGRTSAGAFYVCTD